MNRALVCLTLALICPAARARTPERDQLLTVPEYKNGLKELRLHFVKRDEDPAVADQYIRSLENAFPAGLGQPVPVTRGVFDAFLKYQAAWTRKTRDRKNPNVSVEELNKEIERAEELKEAFRREAAAKSPRFYAAFQSAVREVRALRRTDGKSYQGNSSVFFSDQIDPSYSHVDAGDEALEKGDAKEAIRRANMALEVNPANADALVLRAAAQYERGETQAAVADAQAALLLDPANRAAKAVLSLTDSPAAARAAVADAAAGGANLVGRWRTLPSDVGVTADAREARRALSAPSATPTVERVLAAQLSMRAVDMAAKDPRASLRQLDQAMALDPVNDLARDWHSTIANRNGDYAAALASARRAVDDDPHEALSYFNKAWALGGSGDKKGMLEALEQAAKLDSAYAPALRQARELGEAELVENLFADPANRHLPDPPRPYGTAEPLPLWIFGWVGAALLSAGAVLLYRSGAGKGPAIVRR